LPKESQAGTPSRCGRFPTLTGEEQAAYLATRPARSRRAAGCRTNSCPSPNTVSKRAPANRAQRCLPQVGGANAFHSESFNSDRGLMNEDGTVGTTIAPLGTTAAGPGGAKYLGSFNLPNKSVNHIFQRRRPASRWSSGSDRTTTERLSLGDDVSQIGIYGDRPTKKKSRKVKKASRGPLPTFITGLNAPCFGADVGDDGSRTQGPSVLGVTRGQPRSP